MLCQDSAERWLARPAESSHIRSESHRRSPGRCRPAVPPRTVGRPRRVWSSRPPDVSLLPADAAADPGRAGVHGCRPGCQYPPPEL